MNMILKKRSANRRGRGGFTLVEVIVVLVILAILAAIAIPALTGYIDKAEDKQYIAEARNATAAMRTVLDELYASDELANNAAAKAEFLTNTNFRGDGGGVMLFDIGHISSQISTDYHKFWREAAALISEPYPTGTGFQNERFWFFYPMAAKDSGATAATADGFFFQLYPKGNAAGNPAIFVTYRLKHFTAGTEDLSAWMSAFNSGMIYSPDAGYEVYHLTTQ
jgi:prepilin-type N-terminal cleavage/methylation domain-containing protein